MLKPLGTKGTREYAWAPITGVLFSRPTTGKRRLWHSDGPYGQKLTLEQAQAWIAKEATR